MYRPLYSGCYLPDKLHFCGKEIVHLWSAANWKHLLLEEESSASGIIDNSFYKPFFFFLLVRAGAGKNFYKSREHCLEVKYQLAMWFLEST
jgi:hypothetical protein